MANAACCCCRSCESDSGERRSIDLREDYAPSPSGSISLYRTSSLTASGSEDEGSVDEGDEDEGSDEEKEGDEENRGNELN